MRTIYVPRAGGGTLILHVQSPPASPVPMLHVTAVFRDGQQGAIHRSGQQEATHRDGTVTPGGR